jgi:hypothetical protein
MGWADSITETTDWTAVAFQAMFITAIQERAAAILDELAGVELPTAEAGAYCLTAGNIEAMQAWLEQNCTLFFRDTQPHPGNTGEGITPVVNLLVWRMWDLTALRAAAGLNVAGFTRKFPREIDILDAAAYSNCDDAVTEGHKALFIGNGRVYVREEGAWVLSPGSLPDLVTRYGHAQPGDYWGPWVWIELRAVLNLLIKTVAYMGGGSVLSIAPVAGSVGYGDGGELQTVYQDAYDAMAADWTVSPESVPSSAWGWATNVHRCNSWFNEGDEYTLRAQASTMTLGVENMPEGLAASAEVWFETWNDPMNSNGLFPAADPWTLHAHTSYGSHAVDASGVIDTYGNTAIPGDFASPAFPSIGTCADRSRGFYASDAVAVLTWDFQYK